MLFTPCARPRIVNHPLSSCYVLRGSFMLLLLCLHASASGQAPPAPTGVTATPGQRTITVSWGASVGADDYMICSTDQADGSNTGCSNAPTTSYTFTNLFNNHTYYFYVLANKNGGYQSAASSRVSATTLPLAAPSITAVTPGKAKLTISWSTVAEASYYVLGSANADGSNVSYSFHYTNSVEVGGYNGRTYRFWVCARNGGGDSSWSPTVYATLSLDAPGGLTAVAGKAKITVSWSAVANADSYKLCSTNANNPTGYSCEMSITGLSRVITAPGIYNGQTYNYYVISTNAAGDSPKSDTVSASLNLAAPTGVVATYNPAHTQVTVSWNAVSDADSYVVVRSTTDPTPSPAPGWSNLGTFTATSFVDAYAYTGVRYYQVVAQNAAGQGLKSMVVSTDGRVFPCSPTEQCAVPYDYGSGDDPVNLATGMEDYKQRPDLVVYNPGGPQVTWQRQYLVHQALSGYASPGLANGWVHTYDISLQGPATAGTWGPLMLRYYNGAVETLTPVLDGAGQPTGTLMPPTGAPYLVQGIAGASAGAWQSVTVTGKDQTQWYFTPLSSGAYALSRITNRMGQSITLTWSGSRVLTQVSDTDSGGALLSLSYGGDGRLASATDRYDRQISYGYNAPYGSNAGLLRTVSQVVSVGTGNPPARWTYGYAVMGQLLNRITVPSATGSGTSTATINYDSLGRVASLVDANGIQRVYTYNAGTTQVQVKNAANVVVQSWTQKFTGQRGTGVTDANNKSTTIEYNDPQNPGKPTRVTDKNDKATTYTYDQYGNVLTVTNPRNVTTTYIWNYTAFPLGRLTSVQEGAKPATTVTYYEPSGLVQSLMSPSPTGSGTVTTFYTYDSLGNVLTVARPGNNASSQITTTYNYTTDGAYTQPAKPGQPLTMTDNLGHTTHLR
ncbi:MAG: hypothetical protein ACR2G4_11775 [Pyrinomonadaceae bacterium]